MSRYKQDTPLTGAAIEKRIAELEAERDELLRATENVRLGKHKTAHSEIARKYNYKIGCLRTYGFENAMKYTVLKNQAINTRRANNDVDAMIVKMQATNLKRYSHANGNVEKLLQLKYSDLAMAMATKQRQLIPKT